MMKVYLFLLIFFLFSISCTAQILTVNNLLELTEEKVSIYEPQINSGKHLYLKMNYGSSEILNKQQVKRISGANIVRIDVVYSDHPHDSSFTKLTKNRISQLVSLYPLVLESKEIEWHFIRQTQCVDRKSAAKLFHGIVITFRPVQSKELVKKEIRFLDSLFKEPKAGMVPKEFSLNSRTVTTWTINAKGDSILLKSDTTFYSSPIATVDFYIPSFRTQDSVVQAVLSRNKWKRMAIVADLTGSMSPYTAQLLIWLKLYTTDDKVKQFVFFNDGDMTPDHKKIIGKTGGIYDTRSANYKDVEALAKKTMLNGSGSDAPENDIEALIKSIEICPECENIILIADNWAPIKDFELLNQIKKPIKVVLCGADYGINTQYLDLARATGGSVHTIEKDILDLIKLNEGQELVIGNQFFKITGGKFVKVSKS